MSEITVSQLETAWRTLNSYGLPPVGEIRVYELPVPLVTGSVLLAMDSQGLRHLLVPLLPGESTKEDRKGAGIHVTQHVLLDRGSRGSFIDIACRNAQLHDAFCYLGCQILQELATVSTGVGEACFRALHNWRTLLERERPTVLPRETIIGLFGELLQLRELLRIDPSAVRTWGGPMGHRHDFSNGEVSIEVKTTTARHGLSITINSLDQLAALPSGRLFLSVVSLEEVSEGGLTLGSLVREIEVMAADFGEVLAKIRQYGWEPSVQEEDAGPHLILKSIMMFGVDDKFPRIIPSSIVGGVPPEITNVHYEVDLAGALSRLLSDTVSVYNSILSTV